MKICTMADLCPDVGYSTFDGDIFTVIKLLRFFCINNFSYYDDDYDDNDEMSDNCRIIPSISTCGSSGATSGCSTRLGQASRIRSSWRETCGARYGSRIHSSVTRKRQRSMTSPFSIDYWLSTAPAGCGTLPSEYTWLIRLVGQIDWLINWLIHWLIRLIRSIKLIDRLFDWYSVFVCQKWPKYDAFWQSYCKHKKNDFFAPSCSWQCLVLTRRISATLACPMTLQKYPMDTQICPLMFESCKCLSIDLSATVAITCGTMLRFNYSYVFNYFKVVIIPYSPE